MSGDHMCLGPNVSQPNDNVHFFFNFFSSYLEFNCPGDGTCSNQGICDDSTGICNCDSGFEGQSCEGKMITLVHRIEVQTPQKSAGGRIS